MNDLHSSGVRLHIKGRSASHTMNYDGPSAAAQLQHTADLTMSSAPLPTMRIQQATIFTSQQFTVPARTISAIGGPTMVSEPATPAQEHHGLSSKSIAGLAMIPVAAILIIVATFTYFWLQKRCRLTPIVRHLDPSHPPPVPEKDFRSPIISFDSSASGGKVRCMMAMSTPVVHKGWHASQGLQPQPQPPNSIAVHQSRWSNQLPKLSADITSAGFVGRGAMDIENDSPIDRSSPFRLRRGDTRKRSSLDPVVMGAWPMPPQPAAQSATGGRAYMERRSISTQYFAQERSSYDARGPQEYWEDIRLELGPDPGPTIKS